MHSISKVRGALCVAALLSAFPLPAEPGGEALTLEQALGRAEQASPDVLAARASVQAAKARALQAGYRPNPEASLNVEGFAGSGQYAGLGAAETTLAVSQQLELGGKRAARIAAARAEIDVAEIELSIARADLHRDIRIAFGEAVRTERRADLAREALSRAEELARVAHLLVEAGREPPLRELRAQGAAKEAQAALVSAESEQLTARLALGGLLGVGEPVAAREEGGDEDPSGKILAMTDRLDVKLAEARLRAARAVVERERSLGRPDVTAELGVRNYSETRDQALVAAVRVPLPIYDHNKGATAAATADATVAEVRRNQALAAAGRAEQEALAALAAAQARVATLSISLVPEAREAVRLARLGYREGKFSLLDVLDAETALNQAETSLADARLERTRAVARLERAQATGDAG